MTSFHTLDVADLWRSYCTRKQGHASPNAYSRLSRFSVEDALHNLRPEETLIGLSLHPLECALQHKNTLDGVSIKAGSGRVVGSEAVLRLVYYCTCRSFNIPSGERMNT